MTEYFTDDSQLEIKLKKTLDFKTALDEASIVAITDKDGKITYVNQKFLEISKYSAEELLGQNHRILKSGYHPLEFYEQMWKTISSGKAWHGDIKNRAKDGSFYWVKTTIVPFFGKDGRPEQYIAIRTDISHQKKIEEDLEKSLMEIKALEKEKDEFLSMVAHELKTPLTPIIGWLDALKDPQVVGNLNEIQTNAVNTILSNAEKLECLIGDLLDTKRLELGKMNFASSEFVVSEMLDFITKNFEVTASLKNVKIINSIKEKISLNSDRRRLEQVFTNLINNALDFVAADTGIIEIDAKSQGSSILFSVKDNGVGISEDDLENLFEKFYQIDVTNTRKHGGVGLGLTVCKGIVEGLGGKIWCDSVLHKGSNFYFSIPKGAIS